MGGKLAGSGDLVGQFGDVFLAIPRSEKAVHPRIRYVPNNFRPEDYFDWEEMQKFDEEAIYLVSRIYQGMASRECQPVPLKAETLRRIMGRDYKFVVDRLILHGALERLPFEPGVISFQYILSKEKFGLSKPRRHRLVQPRMLRRLNRFEQMQESRLASNPPISRVDEGALLKRESSLSIDDIAAKQVLASLPNAAEVDRFGLQTLMIEKIKNKDFLIKEGGNGRISNNITSMKREVRKTLRINSKPTASVDIKSSQPALLANLIAQQQRTRRESGEAETGQTETTTYYDAQNRYPPGGGSTCKLPHLVSVHQAESQDDLALSGKSFHANSIFNSPRTQLEGEWTSGLDFSAKDAFRYIKLATSCEFYEFFLEHSKSRMNRQQIKRAFLTDVIAKKGSYPSDLRKLFSRKFPTVNAFIERVCFRNHGNMIRLLQRLEVELVIHRVVPLLIERHPDLGFVTLHDSIYTRNDCIQWVKKAFDDVIKAEGLCFQLSVETG